MNITYSKIESKKINYILTKKKKKKRLFYDAKLVDLWITNFKVVTFTSNLSDIQFSLKESLSRLQ